MSSLVKVLKTYLTIYYGSNVESTYLVGLCRDAIFAYFSCVDFSFFARRASGAGH